MVRNGTVKLDKLNASEIFAEVSLEGTWNFKLMKLWVTGSPRRKGGQNHR